MQTFASANEHGKTSRAKVRRETTGSPNLEPISTYATASHPMLQRKSSCACGGGCPSCMDGTNGLKVSQPNDAAELEADRLADEVMRMPIDDAKPKSNLSNTSDAIYRKCDICEDEEEEASVKPVKRKGAFASYAPTLLPANTPPSIRNVINSGGRPLDLQTRNYFEPRFGSDLGHVRIHTGSTANQSARNIDARAYTLGSDIVFGNGEYKPDSENGKQLIAHELAHVVQRGGDTFSAADTNSIYRRIRRENVSCERNGLRNPDLTGDEVVAALEAADADAIDLAQQAETGLRDNLAAVRAGGAVDAAFDTILREELGLTLTNAAQFGLIEQQANRFQRVRETLESGYLRYMCRGSTTTPISVIGCAPGPCGTEFASSCPGNRLLILCQLFWDTPDQRSVTILHEPFHIWFSMLNHGTSVLRRADSSCFESFALRVAGRAAFASCVGHTNG